MVIRSHRQVEHVVFCLIKSFCRKMKSGFVCMCQRIMSANFACFLEKQMQIVPRLALGYSVSLPDRYDATDFRTHPVLQWKQVRRNSRYIIPTNHSRADALIQYSTFTVVHPRACILFGQAQPPFRTLPVPGSLYPGGLFLFPAQGREQNAG